VNAVVKARHIEITDALRQYVQTKTDRLPRFYSNITSIEVILDTEADQPLVEIVIHGKKKSKFVAKNRAPEMYACIDQCIAKITEQLRRHKDKVKQHRGISHAEVVDREAVDDDDE
jgi:putative sigma-54 modulation protein